MNRPPPKTVRRRFFIALGHAIHVTWPVLSAILAIQVALGLLIGFVEGWSVGDAVYFTFVTGLTIGYGDIVPRQALARVLAIGIGICGLFLTGLTAGILANDNRIVRVNRSLSLRAVGRCAMSLALSSTLRSFAGFVHHHGPAVFFHLTTRRPPRSRGSEEEWGKKKWR
jgi:hypothetical protein